MLVIVIQKVLNVLTAIQATLPHFIFLNMVPRCHLDGIYY